MLPPASAIQHEHFPLATPAPPVTVSVSTGSQTVNKHYFHLVCLSGGFITVWQHPVVVRSVEGKHHPFPSDKGIIAFDLAPPFNISVGSIPDADFNLICPYVSLVHQTDQLKRHETLGHHHP